MVRLLTLAALTLLAAAPAASARRCSQLHQRDLAPAQHVRLVEQRTSEGQRLLGCVLPRGPVREIAARVEYETASEDYDVVRVAREFVLVDRSSSTQYGAGTSTAVINLRTGRGYAVASSCTGMVCTPDEPADSAARALLTETGLVVAAISGQDGMRVSAFAAHGAETVLDRGSAIDSGSLRLRGRTATWLHEGELRSAEI